MKAIIVRACIYPKDIQRIMGKQYKAANYYYNKIRIHFNKEQHQLVSIEELSRYSGLPVETIMAYL